MAERKTARKSFNKSGEGMEAASRLPELNLDAQRLAGLIHGLRKRSKAGQGTEFMSYRPYERGKDDPRRIDWKASARKTDHEGQDLILMRDKEMEVSQNIYVFCDTSSSMDFEAPKEFYPNRPAHTKKEKASILTLAVGYLAVKSSELFTLLGSDLRLMGNKTGVERMLLELENREIYDQGNEESLPKLPVHRGKKLPPNSHVFIFSDFLCPLTEIAQMIESLRGAGIKGHLVQILDPAEVDFRYKGRLKLHDAENGGLFSVEKGEASKHEIEQRIRHHASEIEKMVKKVPSWNYSVYVTDQPTHEALAPLYGIRSTRMPKPTKDYSRK